MNTTRRYCPAHVPEEYVRSLDTYNDPKMAVDPFGALLENAAGIPVYWDDVDAGFKKGCWVITKTKDIRFVLTNPDLFRPNNWVKPQVLAGETWKLIPNTLDGREHMAFRKYLMQWFAGQGLARLVSRVDEFSLDLISSLKDRDSCDFMADYAIRLPISIILELLGLPIERMPQFLEWEYAMVSQSDFTKAAEATKSVIAELKQLIVDRHQKRGEDIPSHTIDAEVMGRPITDEENLSMLYALYLAGLDTVATSLGWQFHALATRPGLQDYLRLNPDRIPDAVDELFRRFSPTVTRRQAMEDVKISNAEIKAGDWVMISTSLGGLDPEEFENPLEIDIDRKNKRHVAFAAGPHTCLGAGLARAESNIAIRQWLEHMPSFRLADGASIAMHGGLTLGIKSLPITWN